MRVSVRNPFVLLIRCLSFLGRLFLSANSDDARIQGAGQGVERCVDSVVDQASHWMGISTIKLHCMDYSLNCSNELSVPSAIGITAHFCFLNCVAGHLLAWALKMAWFESLSQQNSLPLPGHLLLSLVRLHLLAVFGATVGLVEDVSGWSLVYFYFSQQWHLHYPKIISSTRIKLFFLPALLGLTLSFAQCGSCSDRKHLYMNDSGIGGFQVFCGLRSSGWFLVPALQAFQQWLASSSDYKLI